MFKLQRLWELHICEETFPHRDIPEEKRDFSAQFPDNKTLVALFQPSVEYHLIEMYGLDCCTRTDANLLRLEIGYTNYEYILSWILSFGDKVRVLEPAEMALDIRRIAENMLKI